MITDDIIREVIEAQGWTAGDGIEADYNELVQFGRFVVKRPPTFWQRLRALIPHRRPRMVYVRTREAQPDEARLRIEYKEPTQ